MPVVKLCIGNGRVTFALNYHPSRPSEEIFVILNIAPALEQDHTHHQQFST